MRTNNMRPLIKMWGGKGRLSNWVISNFPQKYESMRYTENFLGGGSVFLSKNQCVEETISDKNFEVFSCFAFVKLGKFREIRLIEYNEKNFEIACNGGFGPGLSSIVKYRFSRSGRGDAFSYSSRQRGQQDESLNSWNTYLDLLDWYKDRLRNVTILNCDYRETCTDYINTFMYCDPPYLKSTRVSKDVYTCEFDEKDHIEFLSVINRLKNTKVIISGYMSDLYSKELKDWKLITKSVANNSGENKKKSIKTECLWSNY